jgi:hypothetical protein
MASISKSDTIMASVTLRGKTLATINSNGFSSFSDVVSQLRAKAGSVAGIISINLRNFSQGWSEKRTLYITAPLAAGIQLSLF